MNDINEYQRWTRSTVAYPKSNEGEYLMSALGGEVGEFYGAASKYWRGDYGYDEFQEKIELELGDVMWTLCRIADYYGFDMSTILQGNIQKLTKRVKDNTIKGYDDEETDTRVPNKTD